MEDDRWVKEPDKNDKPNHSKFIIAVILIGVALAAIVALLHGETKVETLTLDKTNVSLGIDETDRLTATVKPDDAKPVLIWESSDENIAKVTDGVVMACNAGNAVIKVSVKDQKELFAVCEYTVLNPDIDMQTLDILEEPIVLRPGGHQQLTVSFTPENQNENILWSSTNESVARVSPRGKVEAIKVGVAKIIATSERTGVADTAVVSVEGSGVVDNIFAQTDNPQNTPTLAQKPASVQNPAPSQKPATTQKSSPAPVSTPAQTSVAKSVPVKASNPTPASTAKTATVSTKKPAQTSAPKTTVSTTPKPAATTVSKPATSTVSKTTTVNTSKPAQTTTTKSSGTKDLGYATFRGTWPNDVKGRMEFKSTHVIDSRDPKNRYASPGDYVIGEWSEGHLVQGVWYGSDNKPKGSILIGK